MSQSSSHAAAKQKLGDLDRRFRKLLDATDRVQDIGKEAIDDFMHAIRQRLDQVTQEVEALRSEFPGQFANLEAKYRAACNGQIFGAKSKWPKRGSSPESPSAEDLMDFAFEEELALEDGLPI
jgi:hypothetical protein